MFNIREDLSCELRNFTTSQFRSKFYLAPMSECYPVAPTVLAHAPQGPIRGLHKLSPFDSDDDVDPIIPPPRHSTAPAPSLVVPQPPTMYNPQFRNLCTTLSLSLLQYPQPLFHQPALQPLLQTARLFQALHLSLLLSFLPRGLAANEVPNFGKIRTGT